MSWFTDLFKSNDVHELEAIAKEALENEQKRKNGLCPCGRSLANCTHPNCYTGRKG